MAVDADVVVDSSFKRICPLSIIPPKFLIAQPSLFQALPLAHTLYF